MSKVNIRKWLQLSEETNALDFLEKAYYYICQTETNVWAWKWVIISLHGALYGFAICTCQGTNYENVTFKTKKGKARLISFDEALERCQNPNWMRMTVLSRPLRLSESQRKSINKLKNLRNQFEHYTPVGWSIELHGMPQIAMDVLKVIRFLALDTGNYVFLTEAQRKRVKYIIFRSKRILSQSQLHKEAKLFRENGRGTKKKTGIN